MIVTHPWFFWHWVGVFINSSSSRLVMTLLHMLVLMDSFTHLQFADDTILKWLQILRSLSITYVCVHVKFWTVSHFTYFCIVRWLKQNLLGFAIFYLGKGFPSVQYKGFGKRIKKEANVLWQFAIYTILLCIDWSRMLSSLRVLSCWQI